MKKMIRTDLVKRCLKVLGLLVVIIGILTMVSKTQAASLSDQRFSKGKPIGTPLLRLERVDLSHAACMKLPSPVHKNEATKTCSEALNKLESGR